LSRVRAALAPGLWQAQAKQLRAPNRAGIPPERLIDVQTARCPTGGTHHRRADCGRRSNLIPHRTFVKALCRALDSHQKRADHPLTSPPEYTRRSPVGRAARLIPTPSEPRARERQDHDPARRATSLTLAVPAAVAILYGIVQTFICDLRDLVFRGMPRRAVWLCP
jgi:hypothetical protein